MRRRGSLFLLASRYFLDATFHSLSHSNVLSLLVQMLLTVTAFAQACNFYLQIVK